MSRKPSVRGFVRWRSVLVCLGLVALLPMSTPTANVSQDLTFRLMNIERRLDQLQQRVDGLEREYRSQSIGGARSPGVAPETVLELQRQQLAMAEQVVLMQQQMLQLRKTVDQLAEQSTGQDKGEKPKVEKPKEEAKPKAPPRRP